MAQTDTKLLPLYPESLSIVKVISPLKYKRAIVRAVERIGTIEPIQVDPRTGTDQISVDERRTKLELLRTKFEGLLGSMDKSLIKKQVPIPVGSSEDEVLDFVNEIYKTKGKDAEDIIARRDQIKVRVKDLNEIIELLNQLEVIGVESSVIADTSMTKTFLGKIFPGSLNRLHWLVHEITDGRSIVLDEAVSEEDTIVLITILKSDQEAVETKIKTMNFQDITIPTDVDFEGLSIADCNIEISNLESEDATLAGKFVDNTIEFGFVLTAALEVIRVELQRIEVEVSMRRTETTCVLWAWLPEETKENFKTAMHTATDGSAIVDFRKGDFDPEFTPTYYKNNKFMKPMRGLVSSFGIPATTEIDPYPFVRILFPVLFAIMFADVGHGAILFLLGLRAYSKRKDMTEIPKGISGYYYGGAELLMILGATSFFFGFIFNSFFGDETILWTIAPIRFLFEKWSWAFFFTTETQVIDGHEVTTPERNYQAFLVFSFAVGAIVILMGLFLKIYQLKNRRRSNTEMYAQLTLTAIYVSAILAAIFIAVGLGTLGSIFIISSIINLFATVTIEKRAHGVNGLMLAVDHIISLLSNTFSFGRLLAMNTIHFVLAFLPYLFIDKISSAHGVLNHDINGWISPDLLPWWILAAVIGAMIVVPVETVFSTLQALRLNWVEFFGKFYVGNGIEFKPMEINRNFTVEQSTAG